MITHEKHRFILRYILKSYNRRLGSGEKQYSLESELHYPERAYIPGMRINFTDNPFNPENRYTDNKI